VYRLSNKNLLNRIHQTEVAVLESLYFKWCILNANKIDVVAYFCKVIGYASSCYYDSEFVSKISVKTDKSLLNCVNLCWSTVFIETQCILA